MNRGLWSSLLLLLAVLAGGVILTSAEAAPPKKAEQDKDAVDLPPPPKSTTLAPRPKTLSRSVHAGLKFLVGQQQPNGGWGDMLGFGFGFGGPPVGGVLGGRPGLQPRGKPGQQGGPTDVANTSIAGLALLRASYSPRQGTYSGNLRKALAYVCGEIEKSDMESLPLGGGQIPQPGVKPGARPPLGGARVGGIMGQTQVQRKIGNNVDTFLAALLLSEARGKMPDAKSEKRLGKALVKVLDKIQRHQKEDGTWADVAWAPVLGQALGSRALNRARQVGVAVDPEKLARTAKHARDNFDNVAKMGARPTGVGRPPVGKTPVGRPGLGGPGIGFPGVGFPGGLGGAAGVSLYATAAGIGGLYDSLMTLRQNAGNARAILNSPSVTDNEKARAKEQIKQAGDADKSFLDSIRSVAKMAADPAFVRGFGSDGGEEFLSFALIGEALRAKDPQRWATWDRSITQRLTRTQNRDGSWSGAHCISGKIFCTAAALLSLMSDRASIPLAEKLKQ